MTNSHRRPRGRTVAATSLAAFALLCAGAASMNGAFADEPGIPVQGSVPQDVSGDTAPATPRSLTAALTTAAAEVADGTASDFRGRSLTSVTWKQTHERGDDPRLGADLLRSELTFEPTDGSGAGRVTVDLIDRTDPAQHKAAERFLTCQVDHLADCHSTRLPDGSLLMTWTSTGWTLPGKETIETLHADRLVGDALFSFTADNFVDADNGVTRTNPVLSADELRKLASQPWWGLDLPTELMNAELPGYQESDWSSS